MIYRGKRPSERRRRRARATIFLCACAVGVWLAVTVWLFLTLDRQARSLMTGAQSERVCPAPQVSPAPRVRWTLR